MSREIKIRAWDTVLGFMLYWEDIVRDSQLLCVILDDTYVCQQYINICDIDEKEIYEGDIVKVFPLFKPSFTGTILFKEGCFFVESNDRNSLTPVYQLVCPFKVLGNIYENPELLEDDHE